MADLGQRGVCPHGVSLLLQCAECERDRALLSEDTAPITLVPERVRDAWGPPKKKAYTREQYEADKKARERRDG